MARPFATPSQLAQEVWHPDEETDMIERLLSLHVAKRDEASLALEDAERLFSGKSHAVDLWCQLRTLQLRVFAEHHFLDPLWAHCCNSQDQNHTDLTPDLPRQFPSPWYLRFSLSYRDVEELLAERVDSR